MTLKLSNFGLMVVLHNSVVSLPSSCFRNLIIKSTLNGTILKQTMERVLWMRLVVLWNMLFAYMGLQTDLPSNPQSSLLSTQMKCCQKLIFSMWRINPWSSNINQNVQKKQKKLKEHWKFTVLSDLCKIHPANWSFLWPQNLTILSLKSSTE